MDQQILYNACESGDLKEIQQLHAHNGAAMDVTRPNNNGWTPMWLACFDAHLEIVQWLHEHGAAMDVTRPDNEGGTPMLIACANGHFEIVQWLHEHGAAMDVTRPNNDGETPMDRACRKGYLNIVKHLIHHHKIPPDTLEQWHPKLSSSNKIQLHQAAQENLFHWDTHCQSFLTLATIVCFIKTEPYEVMNEATGRLVVPRSSILTFRRQIVKRRLLRMVASYICGGEDTRHVYHIWHLIRMKN